MPFDPSQRYILVSIIVSALIGLIAFGFMLFSAFINKRHKRLGIFAAVFQFLNVISTALLVIAYCKIDFSQIVNNQSKITEAAQKYINENMGIISMLGLASITMLASFIITTVFLVKLLKGQGNRTISIIALVSNIAIFTILQPINPFQNINQLTEQSQLIYDIIFRIICLTPSALTFANSFILYKKYKNGEISLDEPVYNNGFGYGGIYVDEPLQTNFYPDAPSCERSNKYEYTVILTSLGFHKLDAVKIISEVLDISMDEARFLAIESPLPNTIAKDVPKGIATELEIRLTEVGAKLEIV